MTFSPTRRAQSAVSDHAKRQLALNADRSLVAAGHRVMGGIDFHALVLVLELVIREGPASREV